MVNDFYGLGSRKECLCVASTFFTCKSKKVAISQLETANYSNSSLHYAQSQAMCEQIWINEIEVASKCTEVTLTSKVQFFLVDDQQTFSLYGDWTFDS